MMRPPFEEGVCFDLIGVVGEDTATLGKNLIEFLQSLEVFIDDRLVRQRPQAFGGLDLWRVRGQEHQFNAFRNFQILGDMPARAVEHQNDALVGAGARLGGERRQERAEQRGVDAIGDEPHDLARGGPDEAVQIEPLVAVMAAGGRAASPWRPDFAQDRFQSEAVFIECPDLDRNRRFGALEFADAGLELFLNRTCSYRFALGLAGRGTWRVSSRRRRYSTPRCGDTLRPIRPVIQHATLRPVHSPLSGGGSLTTSRSSSSWTSSSSGAAPGLSSRPSPSPARPWSL